VGAWVLMLMSTIHYGLATETVAGFSSESACKTAGVTWQAKANDMYGGRNHQFMCVPQSN
jgi:hypothetical protein